MSGGERSDDGLAPVIPLFGGPVAQPVSTPRRPVAFSEEYWADDDPVEVEPASGDVPDELIDRDALRESAAASLVRSLARRGLSFAEAKTRLRGEGLSDDESTAVIDDFTERGWLDDAILAEQLVHSATTRKGMGTKAIRQLLMKRAVAREVIDDVIAELPDDDVERALEFARTRARSLASLDRTTALRRLTGQLARRGYSSSSALSAARQALDEARLEGRVASDVDRRG